jgi:signal transduction histidine kinase
MNDVEWTGWIRQVLAVVRPYRDPAYETEMTRLDETRTRIFCTMGFTVYVAFWGLDRLVYPAQAATFGVMRAAVALLCTAPLLCLRWGTPAVARRLAQATALAAAGSIAVMCAMTEGFGSSYVVGLILCILAITAIELFRPAGLAALFGLVYVTYAGTNAWLQPGTPARVAAASLSFLLGSMFFLLLAAVMFELQRRRLFEARAELAERNGALVKAQEHQREFLRTVTHELRTPLNSILGFIELARAEDAALSAGTSRRLAYVTTSAQRLLRIINDILDLSAMEAGRFTVQRARFNVAPVLRDVADETRALLTKRDVAVVVDSPEDLFLDSDEKRVRQILLNLTGNAAKFTFEGQIRLVGATGDDGSVVLRVEDTGVGIATDDQARVFEVFAQTAEGVKQGGTGLGLSIVGKLVRLLGGHTTLQSAPGAGTVFRVELPQKNGVTSHD